MSEPLTKNKLYCCDCGPRTYKTILHSECPKEQLTLQSLKSALEEFEKTTDKEISNNSIDGINSGIRIARVLLRKAFPAIYENENGD